ncbi:MAG: glutamate--cysteine ligase [Gammaproteobacteria bacterium]
MQQLNPSHPTPHLTTALTGPLHLLEKQLLSQQQEIENWFQDQWHLSPAPVYGSVDLRNSGFKIAPVDMNLFPAGFNNLNTEFLPLSIDAAKIVITKLAPHVKNILLITESHTRNLFYWDSVNALLHILLTAGFDARVGTLLPDYEKPGELTLHNGNKIRIETIKRKDNIIGLNDFLPDVILLNNDLSDGIPDILNNLQQPVLPPAELGWSQRLKSGHFNHYANVSSEFATLIDIDPWFIAPLFRHCGEIDFMKREAEDCLTMNVERLFADIEKKYAEYEIAYNPFVIIKADAGTYGMAVMTVRSVDEVRSLNRKQRTHMSKSKGGQPVQKVIMQEGIYTFETWGTDNAIAEPVVYLMGERVVGGFYRVHKDRGIDENLNSPGMKFEPLAFASPCQKPMTNCPEGVGHNRFYAYGVVARLSMLAAAREIAEQQAK